jgi:two-component system cell cycle response regulator CtrA
MCVLMIERDPSAFASHISDDRFHVTCAEDADEAMSLLRHETYDVVLLSMGAQPADGLNLIRRMRASKDDTPLVALTGTRVADRVTALSLGADDALSDPLDPAELRARLTSILRRTRSSSRPVLRVGEISLCLTTREAWFQDRPVRLTPKETTVLELMMLRTGSVLTKSTFMNNLYSRTEDKPEIKIIDVFICKLRTKLDHAGARGFISTVWGHGYTIRDPKEHGFSTNGAVTPADQSFAV